MSGSLTISTSGTPARFRSTARRAGEAVVHRLAGVLFHVHAGDADVDRRPVGARADLDAAAGRKRPVELRDLVSLREVGIEVVLAREDRRRLNRAPERDRRADRPARRRASFSTGSAPGSARHTGQVLAFGGAPKSVEHRQKILVAVFELHVHLEPDHHLVPLAPGGARRRDHRCASSPSARSSAYAATNICRSSKWLAMSWPPTGSPSTRPIGSDIAGTPARFAVHVKMSLRYISYGSDLAPSGNAVVGVVGVNSRCTPLSKTLGEVARDQAAHLLRLAIVGVVVAGREHVRAEEDAARDLRTEARGPRCFVHAAQAVRLRCAVRTARRRSARGSTTLRPAR